MAVTINGVAPTTAQQREFAEAMGLPVLLQTITVSTAQQDLDFSGLNLDSDKNYRIELVAIAAASENQEVFCYYNADLTAANYQNQYIVASGTGTTIARNQTASAALGGTPANTTQTARATLTISKVAGKAPVLQSVNGYEAAGGSVVTSYTHRWSGTANVTAIKLRHASTFGAGTVARLYKV